jgi:hypothetical protein
MLELDTSAHAPAPLARPVTSALNDDRVAAVLMADLRGWAFSRGRSGSAPRPSAKHAKARVVLLAMAMLGPEAASIRGLADAVGMDYSDVARMLNILVVAGLAKVRGRVAVLRQTGLGRSVGRQFSRVLEVDWDRVRELAGVGEAGGGGGAGEVARVFRERCGRRLATVGGDRLGIALPATLARTIKARDEVMAELKIPASCLRRGAKGGLTQRPAAVRQRARLADAMLDRGHCTREIAWSWGSRHPTAVENAAERAMKVGGGA